LVRLIQQRYQLFGGTAAAMNIKRVLQAKIVSLMGCQEVARSDIAAMRGSEKQKDLLPESAARVWLACSTTND
jgi:hypothetical protein